MSAQRDTWDILSVRRSASESLEVFGWMKCIGLLRKLRHRGLERVGWMFTFTAAAYNLVRIRNLMRGSPQPQCA
jgi:hypothetical protein